MQTFFPADTHFDDEHAIQYFDDPFRSVEEMNMAMGERWNQVASKMAQLRRTGVG